MVWDIFIVVDDVSVFYTVKQGFETLSSDYHVTVFAGGKHCLDYLKTHTGPDLFILDLLMPDMNGWEIQKQLQRNIKWRHTPILFLLGTKDETSKLIGQLGGTAFIEKPLSLPSLKKQIDRLLKT